MKSKLTWRLPALTILSSDLFQVLTQFWAQADAPKYINWGKEWKDFWFFFFFHVSFLSWCDDWSHSIVMLWGTDFPILFLVYLYLTRNSQDIQITLELPITAGHSCFLQKVQKVHTDPIGLQANVFCHSLNCTRTRKPWTLVSSIFLPDILWAFLIELRTQKFLRMYSAKSVAPIENCKKPQMNLLTPKLCWILWQSNFRHHLTVWSMHRVCVCFQYRNELSK